TVLFCMAMAGCALAAPKAPDPFANLEFRNLGPSVAGGRVTAVTGIPGKAGIYYVGTAGGGVWKTTDNGQSWKSLLEHGRTGSIGAVALAPSNPNEVWVGTGEANVRNTVLLGRGIYFSPDGGKTWQFKGLGKAGQIARIVVNPTNPDIVYVAVLGDPWKPTETRGVYMTTDGGDHWKKVLYVNDTTGASDIAMDPANPNVMFAGMWTEQRRPWTQVNGSTDGGIWRSLDGGRTWTKLAKGLPTDLPTDRVNIEIAPSDPDTLYALMATKKCILWGSDDMGDSWHCISNNHALSVRPFYFSVIQAAPDNVQTLYIGAFRLLKSTDGGKSVKIIDKGVHVDHHALWIDPTNPERMIQGNDGGAYASINGGKNWRYFGNLPIGQFYTVAIRHTVPFGVCGGLQDNNAACGPSNSLSPAGIWGADWWNPAGGDGIYVVPAPSDPKIVYAESQNGFVARIDTRTMTAKIIRPTLGGANDQPISTAEYRYDWASPIAVSRTDPDTLYLGANVVFKSTDGGTSWQVISQDLSRDIEAHQPIAGGPVFHDISGAENTGAILSLVIAPTNPEVLWAGTDDGLVWVTKDGGAHWHNVSPGLPSSVEYGRIYQIGVSPFDAGTAYITVDGHMLGDNHPYVFKTDDYGSDWDSIADGLPGDYSAMVVREDPNRKGLLALGTMYGLYLSFDDGENWREMSANLPTMPVWDLKFTKSPHDLVLATHGRGLWILDNLQALEYWDRDIADEAFHLFPASRGTQWIGFYGRHIGPPPGAFVAPNPPSGPQIAYYLAQPAGTASGGNEADKGAEGNGKKKGPVTITVTDSAGNQIATLHGPGKAGINRIAWNMRYKGIELPKFLETESPSSDSGPDGPLALPGSYTITASVGGHEDSTQVRMRADPRLDTDIVAQRAMLETGLTLRNQTQAAITMLDRIHAQIGTLDKILAATAKAGEGSAEGKLHAAAAKLKRQLGGFAMKLYNPKLQFSVPADTLHYISRFGMRFYNLYRGLLFAGPNQTLNARHRAHIAAMQQELQQYLDTYNGKLRPAVANFNRAAYQAGVQTLPGGDPIKVAPTRLPPAARGGA
ncbi:MAG: hypothetical protein L0I62_09040, partial [Gammaproteobacteria bacterium]|nr:hypothetical protein [Gammaproteobacteria bacterium]